MATEQLRWGVSPLCWTNDVLEDLGGDIPLDTCLREAREAGYQGIELGRKFPRQAATLGSMLAAADLRLASGWYSGMLADRSVEAELEAVREHAERTVPRYALPHRLEVIEEMPRSQIGKILRRVVRERVLAGDG